MKYILLSLLISSPVFAEDLFDLAEGYHLRSQPSISGHIYYTTHGANEVTVLESSGDWRFICVAKTPDASCSSGKKYWVAAEALKPVGTQAPKDVSKNENAETEATHCPTGTSCAKPERKPTDAIKPLAKELDPNDPIPHGYKLPADFAAACSEFIKPSGLGDWGVAMVNAAAKNAPNCFYNTNLFGSMCKGYKDLPLSKKNALIAMTFAAIANTESTCKPKSQAVGINDYADGLFQLEHSARQRADAGRSSQWCSPYKEVNTFSLKFQSECAVSTVEDTVCGWGTIIFDPSGYWQKLRGRREIAQLIRKTAAKWKLCQ